MDLNSLAVLGLIMSGSASSKIQPQLIDRYNVETVEGVKFTIQADQCNLYYSNTTLGCYKDGEWVLIAPWDKIKHFKQEEK